MKKPKRIAVILPNWVGDVVMSTPALGAIRKIFADACIVYVGKALSLATIAGSDWADEVIEDVSNAASFPEGFVTTAAAMRRKRIDLAILLPNSFRSAVLARLGGCRRIAGYSRDCRGILLSDKLNANRDANGKFIPGTMIDYYNKLPEYFHAGPLDIGYEMSLPVCQSDENLAREMLTQAGVDRNKPVVMLNPGCSFGPSKMWSLEGYAQLADELIERTNCSIIINAAPSERRIASQVASYMRHAPAINFADLDNTISLLKSLTKRSSLLVTNDTGARHIAAAFGISLVTLFSSTDPKWTDLHYARERIVKVSIPCQPCQKKLCPQPVGPLYQKCTNDIKCETVLAACLELLASNGKS